MDKEEKALFDLAEESIFKGTIDRESALKILHLPDKYVLLLAYVAKKVRDHFHPPNIIEFCSIINAKSGACSEDCKFCAQSKHYKTSIKSYPLVSEEKILEGAYKALDTGAYRYCLVLSGKGAKKREIERLCRATQRIIQEKLPLNICVSAGIVDRESLENLKKAGVTRINHNLETSSLFFPKIVTTHTWEERYETIKNIKASGLSTCSGGIFGLGEKEEDRVDLALSLKELNVDSIPLNFLMPIKGTPLENAPGISPLEALKVIAMFRFTNPKAEIRLCGGREINLRDYQGIALLMVNGIIAGGYLTRPGRDVNSDFQMVKDAKYELRKVM